MGWSNSVYHIQVDGFKIKIPPKSARMRSAPRARGRKRGGAGRGSGGRQEVREEETSSSGDSADETARHVVNDSFQNQAQKRQRVRDGAVAGHPAERPSSVNEIIDVDGENSAEGGRGGVASFSHGLRALDRTTGIYISLTTRLCFMPSCQ